MIHIYLIVRISINCLITNSLIENYFIQLTMYDYNIFYKEPTNPALNINPKIGYNLGSINYNQSYNLIYGNNIADAIPSDNLEENLNRLKMLMDLKEQISNDEIINQIDNNDFSKLKEYLSINSELRDNLNRLFLTSTIDDLYNKLIKSNKTIILKGMQIANQNKDKFTFDFLNKILKNSENLS